MAWKQATKFWFADGEAPNVIFVSRGAATDYGPEPDTWTTVDLAPFGVSRYANSVFVTGILGITHGGAVEIADLHVSFRRLGDLTVPLARHTYEGQVAEAQTEGGQRSGFSTMAPALNGFLEYNYYVATPGVWPERSSYFINLVMPFWCE